MWPSQSPNKEYTPVSSSDDESRDNEYPLRSRHTHNQRPIYITVLLIAACFLAGISGFFLSQAVSDYARARHQPQTSQALPLEMVEHTFRYNRDFSYPPSNHTNRAWRDIFPEEGGFFIHPTVAPSRSTFSVFHQLHCLNGLRGGYFANQRAASQGHKLTDDDLPVDIQQSHMRHCIDLLRQALMCQADTTLEVVDEEINGVHGFKTRHTCKNWDQLKEWTSEQQRKLHVEQIV